METGNHSQYIKKPHLYGILRFEQTGTPQQLYQAGPERLDILPGTNTGINHYQQAGLGKSPRNPGSQKGKNKCIQKVPSQSHSQFSAPFRTSGKLSLIGLACCGYCGKKLTNGSYYNHWQTKSGQKKASFTGRYLCPGKCTARSCYSQNYLEGAVFAAVERYLEQIKNIDLENDLMQIHLQHCKKLEQKQNQLQKSKKAVQADIISLEEKIPEAIRGDYFFSAEKLSSILKDKEQALWDLQSQEEILHAMLQKAKEERDINSQKISLQNKCSFFS